MIKKSKQILLTKDDKKSKQILLTKGDKKKVNKYYLPKIVTNVKICRGDNNIVK